MEKNNSLNPLPHCW